LRPNPASLGRRRTNPTRDRLMIFDTCPGLRGWTNLQRQPLDRRRSRR